MFRFLVTFAALAALTSGEMLTLSQEAKDKFVALHNQYRQATGTKMADLTWSDTLEEAAKAVGSPCRFEHPQDDFHYGENIFITSRDVTASYSASDVASDASSNWHTEIKNVDDVWDCIANNPGATCGHYSQEVWAETTEIGCSVNTGCSIWGNTWTLVFCEYAPQGNMMMSYNFEDQKWIAQHPY